MDDLGLLPIGRRVAAFRKLRGFTQAGLAARLHRSESWVTKIERGERRIDSMTVLLELSRALTIPVHQLTGQYEAGLGPGAGRDGLNLAELRLVLDRPAMAGPVTGEPPTASETERATTALYHRYRHSTRHITTVLPQLAGLISHGQQAARAVPVADRPRVYAAVALLYRIAATGLRHTGDLTRARAALGRAMSAAEQSGDPLVVGAVTGFLALQLMLEGDGGSGVAVAADVAEVVARDPRADTPAGAVVLGGLHHYAAAAAAKAGDEAEARRLLKVAGRSAERLGREHEANGVQFGPQNLLLQEMSVLVFVDRPEDALARAAAIRPDQLGSTCRAGQYYAMLSTAQCLRGQDVPALESLAAGFRTAPEVVREHLFTRQMVQDMLHRRRHASERLRRIARAMHLPGN